MKNFTYLFFALLMSVFSWQGAAQISGESCTNPIVVNTLPFNDSGNTGDYGNNYGSTDVPAVAQNAVTTGTGSTSYLNGDDVVYAYTPSANQIINVSTTNDNDWIGLWAFTGCPFASTVGYHVATSGATREISELPVLAGTTYYFVISTWPTPQSTDYTISITALTCPTPTALASTNLTTTTADIEWMAGSTETSWNISWGEPGYTPGDANELGTDTASATSYQVAGLTPGTKYDVYVQADCGGTDGLSDWTGPLSFTSVCAPITSMFEDFDSYATGSIVPDCWERLTAATSSGSQSISSTTPASGTRNIYHYTGSTSSSVIVVLPEFSNIDAGTHWLRLQARVTSGTGTLSVGYVTDITDYDSFTLIEDVIITNTSYGTDSEYTVVVPNTVPAGARLGIKSEANGTSHYWDDVYWEPIPTCLWPTALVVTSAFDTIADIEWTAGDTETDWNISWGTPGYTPGDADEIDTASVSNNPEYQITGLTADTHYDVYVQADCGAGDGVSTWAGPLEIFTGYCIPSSTNNTDEIRNFTLSNLNNNSAASEGIDGYSDYSNSVAPAELQAGVPYVASLTSGTGYGNHGAAIWIDLNQNGVFEASEMVTFLPSTIGASETVDFPEFTLPNNTSLDTYRLRVQYHYNKSGEDLDPCVTTSNFSETEDYAITVLAPPSCVPPSALTTTGMSATTVDIGWTAGDTETAWNVSWGTLGYTPGDADEIDTATAGATSYQITGLTAQTDYDVYVQADCGGGDESAWTGPLSFKTACGVIATMFENFDSYGTGSIVPDCWERLAPATSSGSQTISSTSPASGTRNIYQYTSSTSNPVIVVLPEFDNINTGTHWLRLKARVSSGAPGILSVGYITDASDYDNFTLIQDLSITNTSYTADDAEYTVVVPTSIPTNARIAIKNASDGKSYYWDDVYWEIAPTCIPPTALATTGITTTTADIEWTAGSAETAWNISWGTPGYTPGDTDEIGADVINTTPEFQITNLVADTAYDIYVQADCGGGDESTWAGPLEVFTGYCIPINTGTYYLSNVSTTGAHVDINHTATSRAADGYADLSQTHSVSASAGDSFDLTVSANASTHYFFVWIDLDGDMAFDPSTETVVDTSGDGYSLSFTEQITIPASLPNGEYRVRVGSSWSGSVTPCGPANGEYKDFTLSIVDPPACPAPTELTIDNITVDSADLSWTSNGTETEWEVLYGETGFDPLTQGTTITVNNNPETTLSGLDDSTTYEFYVTAICGVGDESLMAGPVSFTTLCEAATVPYVMDFETATAPDLPSCTSGETLAGSDWTTHDGSTSGFTGNVLRYRWHTTAGDADSWFYTQGIELEAGVDYELSYKYGNNSTTYTESMSVAYGSSPEASAMTNQLADHPNIQLSTPEDELITFTVAADGVYYFGFNANSITNQFYLYLDDISIDLAPIACEAVTDVAVSNETFTTATVTWTASALANDGYIVDVYEEGADITTATAVFTETIGDGTITTSAVTGLIPGTEYDVYVTSVCDEIEDITAISTVVIFTTDSCDAVTNILASAVDYTTATLTWDGATSAADGYLVEVYAENADTTTATPVFSDTVAAGVETIDVIGLVPNTGYDVYITSICDDTNDIETVSDVYTFNTIAVVCEAVTDLVVSATTETAATFTWTASASATEGYVVNVYEAGTTNVVATETLPDGNTTTVEVIGLTADTDYDVTVTSDCGFGETATTAPVEFSTEGCNAVTGVTASNIGHASATIEWTEAAIPAANGYTIEVYETGADTATATPIFDDTALTGATSIEATGLWPETAYDVYVTSECGYDTATADMHTFTTTAVTCDPVTNLMADAITETSATLSWDASASATEGYVVEVYELGEVRGQDTPAFSDTIPAGTTTVDVTGLDPDTEYEVYLDSDCGFDVIETATIEFATEGCSEVTNLTITGMTQTTAMINWDEPAIPAADGYIVEVYEAGADVETATPIFEDTALTGATSIEATDLWPDTTYDVYVTSDCGYDTATAVMDTFTTEPVVCDAVTGITITDETQTGATLSWTDTATAVEGYEVAVYEAGADINTATPVFTASPAAGVTTIDITGLTAAVDGADYDVYVTSKCGFDITETAAVETFTTLPVPCDPVMNVMISNITATSAVVSWDLTATAIDGYVVNVYETGTTTNPVASVPVNAAVGAVGVSGLTGSTATNPKHYDVYVMSKCDFGVTVSSDVETFKTEDVACDIVSDVTISAVTQNGATVNWTDVATAVDGYNIEVYESGTTNLVRVEAVGTGVTTAVLTNLPASTTGTTYDVIVVTKCGYNGATVESAVESFTTLEVTCDTVIVSVDAFTQTTALVSWSASGTAVGNFTIDVYLAGDDPLSDTPVVTGTAAASATDYLVTGLDPATNYEVYVTSECDLGVETTSDEVAFTTDSCDAVTNLVVSNETQTTATVTWEASATASDGYMLTLYEEGAQVSTQILPVSATSFELTGLDPATTYEVMITSDCGEVTMDSALVEFTTESCDAATDVAISDIMLTSATVSWTASATVSDGYIVNVYEAGTTNHVTTVMATSSDTSASLTGLDAGTSYDVVVTSDCGDVTMDAAVVTFTTLACDAVTDIVVSDITQTTATVTWTGTATATEGYEVNVYEAGTTNLLATETAATGVTSVDLTGLDTATAYDVVVTSDCDDVTVDSASVSFTTMTCDAVVAIAYNITQTTATVMWTPSATAVEYIVSVSEGGTEVSSDTITGTSINLTGLLPATTYEVVVTSDCGDVTVDSNLVTINTMSCDAATDVTIAAYTQTTATVTWTASATASDGYEVNVYEAGTTNLVTTVTASASDTSAMITGLDADTAYDVVVTSDCGDVTMDSAPVSFTTDSCDAVTDVTIAAYTQTTATVTWTASATASEGYEVNVYEAGTTNLVTTVTASASDTSVDLTGLDADTAYDVVVTSDCGDMTVDSAPVSFTTDSCDAVTDVTISAITLNSATVTWTASATASEGYEVNVYESGTTDLVATVTALASDTSVDITGLDAGTAYDVVVTSDCGDMTVDSAAVSFTTDSCDAVTNISVTATQTTATVSWTASATASDGYEVNVYEAGTTTLVATETATATETSVDFTGLDAATSYDVVVTSDCGDVTVDSASVSFTTMTCDAVVAIAYNITQTTATVMWTPSATAVEYIVTVSEGGTVVSSDTITGTSINLTGLLPATSYDVVVTTDCGDVTVDSNLVTFTTESCEAVTNIDVTAITQTTAMVTWTGSATASDGYEVNVYEAGTTDLVTTVTASASDTSALITGLDAATSYDVVVTSDCGDMTVDSDASTFTTDPCDAVTNVDVTAITQTTAMVSWTGSATAVDGYEVNVYEAGTTTLVATETATATETSVDLTGLDGATSYDVIVTSDCGESTMNSDVFTFTTDAIACDAVTDVIISDIAETTATVSWTESATAVDGYEVKVYEVDPDSSATTAVFTETVAAGVTTVDVTGLTAETEYKVHVISECGGGVTAIYVETFTTVESVDCDAVTDVEVTDIAAETATVTWTESATAIDGYVVDVYDAGADVSIDTPVFTETVATGITTVDITGLTELTSYDVYVTSDCGSGKTATSEVVTFTTDELIGVGDFDFVNLEVFPNPVSTDLYLSATKVIEEVQVYNVLGQLVMTHKFNDAKVTLDVSSLSTATYLLKVKVDGVTGTLRFVKK